MTTAARGAPPGWPWRRSRKAGRFERRKAVMSTARVAWWVWAVLVLMITLACTPLSGGSRGWVQTGEGRPSPALPPTQGDIPDGFDGRRDTPHFVLLWHPGETARDEIDTGEARAEDLFARLATALGPARTPEARLIILFEGDGLSPTGQYQPTHNDTSVRVHL